MIVLVSCPTLTLSIPSTQQPGYKHQGKGDACAQLLYVPRTADSSFRNIECLQFAGTVPTDPCRLLRLREKNDRPGVRYHQNPRHLAEEHNEQTTDMIIFPSSRYPQKRSICCHPLGTQEADAPLTISYTYSQRAKQQESNFFIL